MAHVRDLRGVVEREEAAMGVLISLQEPTRAMRQEVASAGFYHSPGWDRDYPRLQLLTVADLFAGQGDCVSAHEQRDVSAGAAGEAGGGGGAVVITWI